MRVIAGALIAATLLALPIAGRAQTSPGVSPSPTAPPPTGTRPSEPGTRPPELPPRPGMPGATTPPPIQVPGSPLTTPGPPVGSPLPPGQQPVGQPVAPLGVPGAPVTTPSPMPPVMAPGPGGPGGPTAVPQTPAPGGPEPAAGQVRLVSLPQALDIALGQQPNIQARLYDYAAARYRVDQAISPMLPQLNASWDVATGQIAVIQRTNVVTKDRRDVTEARLSLSQLLFDFGKNLAATEVQKRLADVAKEDIEVQRDLIALAVKEAYFNLLFAKRLIVVNRQSVERAELNLRSARGFFEVGTRPKSDVTRAEVDVANARVDTIRATNAEKLARVALNTAMGISIDTPTEVENILTYHPLNVESGQLLSEALRQRAEYRQAKLRVDAAEATVKQQIRNFFPDLVGNAFYGGSGFALTEVWEIGASLNWNIFDGGNKIARLRESRALLSGAQVRVQATQLDIWQQVEQALVTVREAEERIQATGKAVESAAENFRLAQGRFDAGVGTILEVTDAQLALTQAQNTESQALADFRIAVSRLERALGRR